MGFFGLLSTFICGGTVIADDINKSQKALSNRNRAIREGKEIYFTGDRDIFRSTETNEIVYHVCADHKDMDIGVKTGRIYKCIDHVQELEDWMAKVYAENNAELARTNQGYYYKRWPLWDKEDKKGMHLGYCKIDKYNGKIIHDISKSKNNDCYIISYANPNCYFKTYNTIPIENGKRIFDTRRIGNKEYENKYMCAAKG